MAMCIRDMMQGNPKLAAMGRVEESLGYNAIASGFRGQRHWTDQYPNGDTAEALLNSSFDWNGIRQPLVVATENDSLNGVAMLFGHLMTGTAQIFADVRTYWSPESVERVTGQKLTGRAEHGIIHLINSGSAALDGTAEQKDAEGKPTLKPHWDITEQEANACPPQPTGVRRCMNTSAGRFLIKLPHPGWRAIYHDPRKPHQGCGSGITDSGRLEC